MKATIEIQNVPEYAKSKPYIVARVSDIDLWFWGAYDNFMDAVAAATEIGGVFIPMK